MTDKLCTACLQPGHLADACKNELVKQARQHHCQCTQRCGDDPCIGVNVVKRCPRHLSLEARIDAEVRSTMLREVRP